MRTIITITTAFAALTTLTSTAAAQNYSPAPQNQQLQQPAPQPTAQPTTVTQTAPVVAPQTQATTSLPDVSAALTISPFHLVAGMLEVTAEFGLDPKSSVAAIAGAGLTTSSGVALLEFEVGGQYRKYLTGDWRSGFHVGAEGLGIMSMLGSTGGASASLIDIRLLPMIGGKHTFGSGFTLEGQFGAGYRFVMGAIRGPGGSVAGAGTGPTATFNINAGWSF